MLCTLIKSRSSCPARPEDGLIDGTSLASVPLPADTVAKSLSIQECDMPCLTRILCTRWDMPNDAMDLVVYFLEPHFVRKSVLSIGVNAVTPSYMAKLWHEMLMPGSCTHGIQNSFIHPSLGYSRAPMMALRDCLVHAQQDTTSCDDSFFSSIGGTSSPMPSTRQRQSRKQSDSRARIR